MTPERWSKVNSVWHAVLARAEDQRSDAVAELCAGDDTLRHDVESLLADRAHASEAGFLSSAVLSASAVLGRGPLIGRFGQYEIRALIGSGGMGEVYRAHDTTLDRDVAIKIVPDLWLADPDRRERFDREARLLAALNHPNIGAIYDLEEHDGVRGFVLELVEGETLDERLSKYAMRGRDPRGLPLADALDIAAQIADALEAAHERGIVHRDLKPANIKITAEGRVKILDFGLAKAGGESDQPLVANPSVKVTGTRAGAVLGTIPYMSPEQARGESVDRRTDVWAFGCVLYEILTGRRAFEGEDATEVISRVLQQDLDFTTLPANTPRIVRRLLQRCLERDRGKRLPHVAVARLQIEEALAVLGAVEPASVRSEHRFERPMALGLIVGTLAGLAIAWFSMSRETPGVSPVTRLLVGVTPAEQIGGTEGRPTRPAFAVSPDGRMLVFSAIRANQRALYVRHFDQVDAQPITGTEGAESPFFSPDGRWVAYWAGGEIRKVPLTGGPSVRVADAPAVFGASWGDDGRIVYSRLTGGLWEVAAAGGEPHQLTTVNSERGELSHRLPHVLPGGEAVLFTLTRNRFPRWDQTQIALYSRRTGVSRVLIEGGADARYVSTGHLVYVMEGALFAAPFDLMALEVTGGSTGVVADVMQAAYFRGQNSDTGAAQFTVSTTGTLVYLPGGVFRPADRSVVWVDRTGRSESLPIAAHAFVTLRLSPDGQQIALSTFGRDRDIWVYAPKRATLNKLTAPGRNGVPIWTRDGDRITYAAGTSGPDSLQWVRADGGGTSERLVHSEYNLMPGTWTPDARELLYYRETAATTARRSFSIPTPPWIWVHHAATKQPPTPLDGPMVDAGGADLSPDGRWIAYHSVESGRLQVYVQAYPGAGRRYQVSADGGISPIWRADGRELFYVRPNVLVPPLGSVESRIMAVPVTTQPAFTFGIPRELFAGKYEMNSPARSYDVTADGQRFLFIKEHARPSEVITQMIVVQNWFEELRRTVPPN